MYIETFPTGRSTRQRPVLIAAKPAFSSMVQPEHMRPGSEHESRTLGAPWRARFAIARGDYAEAMRAPRMRGQGTETPMRLGTTSALNRYPMRALLCERSPCGQLRAP